MTIRLDSAAEAFAAIASVVMAADTGVSDVERDYLFTEIRTLTVFDGLDEDGFSALLTRMTERVAAELPADGATVSAAGVGELARAARDVLTPERRAQALGMARSLAGAEGTEPAEFEVLELLRVGLDA